MADLPSPATKKLTWAAALITGKRDRQPMRLEPFHVHGRYQLVRFIGCGGAGKQRCGVAVFAETEQNQIEARRGAAGLEKLRVSPVRTQQHRPWDLFHRPCDGYSPAEFRSG